MTSRLPGTGPVKATIAPIVAFLLIFLSLCTAALQAQEYDGRLQVIVTDSDTGKPLAASVVLSGPVDTVAETDEHGVAVLSELPDGIFRLKILARGYRSATASSIRTFAGQLTSVRISMTAEHERRVIGTVSVHTLSTPDGVTLDPTVGVGLLGTSLLQTLGATPGVSLGQNQSPNGSLTFQLDGHPGSDTGVDLDGIPMTGPGVAADLRTINTDLFRSGSVSFSPTAGAAGGVVNFHTLEPTLDWQGHGTAQYGSYDQSLSSVAAQGTSGDLGIAVQHTLRSTPDTEFGQTFLDYSGYAFPHDFGRTSFGDLVKLRYDASGNSVGATYIASGNNGGIRCPYDTTLSPCGYGSPATVEKNYRFGAITDSTAFAQGVVRVAAYSFRSSSLADLSDRTFSTIPFPLAQSLISSTFGLTATANISLSTKQSLEITAGHSTTEVTADEVQAPTDFSLSTSTGTTTATIVDTWNLPAKARIDARLGILNYAPGGSSQLAGLRYARNVGAQTLYASYDQSSGLSQDGRSVPLSDAASSLYNCAARTVLGSEPGDGPTRESISTESAGWQYDSARTHFGASLYQQTERNTSLALPISASVLSLPNGYLNIIRSAYNLPLICGTGYSPDASNLYLTSNVAGINLKFSGVRVQATTEIRNRVELETSAAYTKAVLDSSDIRLTNPLSYSRPGSQLNNVPRLQAQALLHLEPRSDLGIESIFGVTYSGSNNASNLPPFAKFDAAFGAIVGPGRLSLVINNLTNIYAGTSVSNEFATSRPTVSGGSVLLAAYPNLPRTATLSYSISLGRNARPSTLDQTSGLGQAAAGGLLVSPLPDAPPKDPFEKNSGSACPPGPSREADLAIDIVRKISAKLKNAYDAQAQYPRTYVPEDDLAGFQIDYLSESDSYSLTLRTKSITAMNALAGCLHLHVGTPADARRIGIYAPTQIYFTEQHLYFSPKVGFYVIPLDPGSAFIQRFRTYSLPTTPPAEPFKVTTSDRCAADVKPDAERLLGQLRDYFASPDPGSGHTQSWTIVRDNLKGGKPFYLLFSDETVAISALMSCGVVAADSDAAIMKLGYDGAAFPIFNFAEALGLYVIKP